MVCTGFSDVRASWKIMAIPEPRTLRNSEGASPSSSLPLKRTEPVTREVPGSRPRVASMVTVLPEPDSPTTPSTWPGSTDRLTPRTAETSPSAVGNVTSRSAISRIGGMAETVGAVQPFCFHEKIAVEDRYERAGPPSAQ